MAKQACPAHDADVGDTDHAHLEPDPPNVAVSYKLQRKGWGLHPHVSPVRVPVLGV